MNNRFDALVVGGGPAGSTIARALTRAGRKVAIIDKKPFPRDKVCAGWVTPAVVAATGIDLQDYARTNVLQPIRSFRTGLIGGEAVFTHYDEVVSYGVRRCEFDHYLLRRSGAEQLLEKPVQNIEHSAQGWRINDTWEAPLLIGAGGHYCPIARHLGADLGRDEGPVTAQEIEFKLDDAQQRRCAVAEDTPELYFSPDLRGYGWCFRKGGWLNIGLGREGVGGITRELTHFLDWLKSEGRIPADLPGRFHGHAYLLHRRPAPRPRIGDGVLLIGDAAGLAYPQSGEGIRPAVESALLAAETILAANGDYRRETLANYEQRLRARFGPGEAPLRLGEGLKHALGAFLLGSSWLTRRVVLDRWFLHRHIPALSA